MRGLEKHVLGLRGSVRDLHPTCPLSVFLPDRLVAEFGEAFYRRRRRNLCSPMARALTDATRRSSSQLLSRIWPNEDDESTRGKRFKTSLPYLVLALFGDGVPHTNSLLNFSVVLTVSRVISVLCHGHILLSAPP
jgi:hypothetical protein